MKVKEILKGCAWGLLGLLVLTIATLIIIAIVVGDEDDEQPTRATQPAPAQVAARVAQSTPTKEPTVAEGIRQTSLNHEYAAGIVVDDSMSDELLQALYFYDPIPESSTAAGRTSGRSTPMVHAPGVSNDPLCGSAGPGEGSDYRREARANGACCTQLPQGSRVHRKRKSWSRSTTTCSRQGFEDFRVAPAIMLALHHMGIMHMALGYRYTLNGHHE